MPRMRSQNIVGSGLTGGADMRGYVSYHENTGNVGVDDPLPVVRPPSPAEQLRAALVLCDRAAGKAEARRFLDMLGLLDVRKCLYVPRDCGLCLGGPCRAE